MQKLTLAAPAKLNLFLEVTGKRPDGYHELSTLFAKISLADTLHIQAEQAPTEQLNLRITGPLAGQLPPDDNNLVLRAVRAFEQHFQMTLRADITLEKQIPMGAGLGGGSSDAAAVLRGLCTLFHKDPLSLLPCAAKLGADVPLFLYPDTFLKGEGIGEKLTPIRAGGPLPWAVIVYPDTAVPTAGVFKRLVLPDNKKTLTNLSNLSKLIKYVQEGDDLSQYQHLLFNRLEDAVLPYVCPVREVKQNFSALGEYSLMSGSGSTVFVLTINRERAEILAGKIKKEGRKVFVVQFGGTEDEDNRNSDSLNG